MQMDRKKDLYIDMIDHARIEVMTHTQTIHGCGAVFSEAVKYFISLYPARHSNWEDDPLAITHGCICCI